MFVSRFAQVTGQEDHLTFREADLVRDAAAKKGDLLSNLLTVALNGPPSTKVHDNLNDNGASIDLAGFYALRKNG